MLNPCARESKGPDWGSSKGKLISDHDMVSSYESQQEAAKGQESRGVFRDAQDFEGI